MDEFQMPEEKTKIICEVYSNPISKYWIEYKPCLDNSCEYKKVSNWKGFFSLYRVLNYNHWIKQWDTWRKHFNIFLGTFLKFYEIIFPKWFNELGGIQWILSDQIIIHTE